MSKSNTRYYFNIVTSSVVVTDIEGTELSSLDEARAEAILDARALMSSAILQGRDISGRSIQICNERKEILLTIGFHEAIDVLE